MRRVHVATAVALLAGCLGFVVRAPLSAASSPSGFTFGAAGDMGAGRAAAATLRNLGNAGTDFFLHLGDFSYGEAIPGGTSTNPDPVAAEAQNWCNFVKTTAKLPGNYPYELLSGGHASAAQGAGTGADGPLADYTACLPDQMHSTIAPGSAYGQDYYFDYPAAAPLARVFMIMAGEQYDNGANDLYTAGSPNSTWLSNAIDQARAHGIPWIIVGTAFNCVTIGQKSCEIGPDLFNLMVTKKVDLILQGHEHGFERSNQFLSGASCSIGATKGAEPAGCMAAPDGSGTYQKNAGPVLVISGTLGVGERPMYPADIEASDFVEVMGGKLTSPNGTGCMTGAFSSKTATLPSPGVPCDPSGQHGFMKYTVTPTQLSAQFVSDNDPETTGSPAFTDSFTIAGGSGAVGTPTPPPDGPTGMVDPGGPTQPSTAGGGYWMLGSGGHVYGFGQAADHGNAEGRLAPGAKAVHLEPTPSGNGYWIVDSAGRVTADGDATWLGNAAGLAAGESVSSLSATPTGNGYWLFTNRGRVLPFGDAVFYGDMSNTDLNGPVLGSIATPSGKGYYMVASDGGIFAFGDAAFRGSMGAVRLNAPVQSLVPTVDGAGYWLVASDGGIFAFGDAPFKGSMGGRPLNKPVVGMVRYADGYLMVGSDGGIFDFSASPFLGSLGANPPNAPIVSVAALNR